MTVAAVTTKRVEETVVTVFDLDGDDVLTIHVGWRVKKPVLVTQVRVTYQRANGNPWVRRLSWRGRNVLKSGGLGADEGSGQFGVNSMDSLPALAEFVAAYAQEPES